jgi:hypothetical protein
MVTAATSLYLERKRLYSLADAAALVGAEAFELSSVSLNADEPAVTLHSPQVREAVSGFLRGNPADTFWCSRMPPPSTAKALRSPFPRPGALRS